MLITSVIDVIEVIDEAGHLRTITPSNIGWMLGIGWMFYIASQILNFIYYKMHPSSPEMWTWGAEEKLEEWTRPGGTETKIQSNKGQNNQVEDSQIEMAELLPQESDNDN